VYERHALWSASPMEYARDRGIPGLLEVNAPLVQEQARYRTLHNAPLAMDMVRRAFRAASAVLAVSEEVASYVRRAEPASAHIQTVPNGVDPRRFHPGVAPTLPYSAFTVGFVGSLKPWHGVDALLRAFARAAPLLPRSRLLIVGDGPQRPTLEAL